MSSDTSTPILQASAIPFRYRKGRAEFCLITSRKGRWGFPKGIIDPGETAVETARKESEEEAGLAGQIDEEPVGSYEYFKWGTTLLVTCYLMEVTDTAKSWEESDWRDRVWHSAEKALESIHRKEVRKMLERALKRLGIDVG